MLVSAVQRSELAIQIHLSLFFWISFSFRSPMASLVAQLVKIHLQCGRPGFDPWVAKSPWRGERLSTPVFWPGESPSLYSPWGRKESDTTEWLSLGLPQTPEMNREIGIGHIYTSDMCTKQITDENLLCSTDHWWESAVQHTDFPDSPFVLSSRSACTLWLNWSF